MAPRPTQFERRELAGLTWFILVAGFLASGLAWLAWRDAARAQNDAELSQRAEDLSERLAASVRRHDQVLLSTAGLFAASHEVSRDEFSSFSAALGRGQSLPEARSSVWIQGRPESARVVYATTRSGWAAPGAAAELRGGHRTGAEGDARRQPGGAHQDLRQADPRARGPRDGATGLRGGAHTVAGFVIAVSELTGWVALKLRARAFLANDIHTFAAQGQAVLFSPWGQPVSWSTPRTVPPVLEDDEIHREDHLDLQGGTWVLKTSLAGAAGDPIDRTGPNVTLFLGVVLTLLLFALLRLRRRAVREARSRARDLRDNEEQFRALATSSPVGICLLDDAEECRYVNQRWADIHGIDPEQAIGKEALPTLDPPDRAAWEAAIERGRQGEETTIECRLVRPEGGEHWVVYHGAPLRHENGEIRGWVVSAVDVTDRRAYEVAAEAARSARRAHGTSEPGPADGAAGARARRQPPAGPLDRRAVHRSRPHEGGQRLVRARRRRRGDPDGRAPARPDRPAGRHGRPLRERRVRGHLRGRGRRDRRPARGRAARGRPGGAPGGGGPAAERDRQHRDRLRALRGRSRRGPARRRRRPLPGEAPRRRRDRALRRPPEHQGPSAARARERPARRDRPRRVRGLLPAARGAALAPRRRLRGAHPVASRRRARGLRTTSSRSRRRPASSCRSAAGSWPRPASRRRAGTRRRTAGRCACR